MNGAMMLPEFDHEMANTRRTLERVTEEHFDFRPHEKSWTMKELATHVARLPSWVGVTLETEELDVDAGDWPTPEIGSTEDLLDLFDASVAEARAALEKASGDDLMVPWSMVTGGEAAFTMPRAAVLRSFVLNHGIHHRAQLTVYLRLRDIPVPALYGPSADEAR